MKQALRCNVPFATRRLHAIILSFHGWIEIEYFLVREKHFFQCTPVQSSEEIHATMKPLICVAGLSTCTGMRLKAWKFKSAFAILGNEVAETPSS